MTHHIEQMLFPIADTLQTPLEVDADGATGTLDQVVGLGPWKVAVKGKVSTLAYTAQLVAVVAHLRKDLYLLLLTTKQGHEIRGMLFDGAKAGVKNGIVPGNLTMAFSKVKEATVKFLKFDIPSESWRTIDAFDLD